MKTVDQIATDIVDAAFKIHLKLSGKTLGFLINFNVPLIKQGIRRIANQHPES